MWSFYGLINMRTKKYTQWFISLQVRSRPQSNTNLLSGKKILEIRVILEIRETKRDYNYG